MKIYCESDSNQFNNIIPPYALTINLKLAPRIHDARISPNLFRQKSLY